MNTKSIVIVTVNYKTARLTCNLIDSVNLAREQLPNLRMIIVDNASGDDSVSVLQNYVASHKLDWVDLVCSSDNGGYAAGNNVAFRKIASDSILCDYLWMLNPDTKLRSGAGLELVNFLEQHSECIAGSRLEDDDGTVQVSSFNFPGVLSELSRGVRLGLLDRFLKPWLVVRPISEGQEGCDWLAGASIMMPYAITQALGLMDEDYFLYFEEVDYCLKAKQLGYSCWYVPSSRVFHAVGAATGISNHRVGAPRRPQYWFDSRRRFFIKNYGWAKWVLADLAFIVGYSTWLLRSRLCGNKQLALEPPQFLRDSIKNSFLFRGFSL